jgi:hypothetical protein
LSPTKSLIVPQTAAKVPGVVDAEVEVGLGLAVATPVANGAPVGMLAAGAVQAATSTPKSAVRIGDLTPT